MIKTIRNYVNTPAAQKFREAQSKWVQEVAQPLVNTLALLGVSEREQPLSKLEATNMSVRSLLRNPHVNVHKGIVNIITKLREI